MADILETYNVRFTVDAGQAKVVLQKSVTAAKNAQKVLDDSVESTSESMGTMGVSFTALITTVVVTAVASLAKVIKDVADTNRRIHNLTRGTTTSAKSLKALENNFKMLGMGAGEADANFESFQRAVADYKYGGELNGQVKAFKTLGVQVLDSNKKARDYYDLLMEAGQRAVKLFKGSQTEAAQYLQSLGFSSNTARLMVEQRGSELKESLKQQAAASESVNDSYQKLNEDFERSKEEFDKMFLEMADRLQIFDKLLFLLNIFSGWAAGADGNSVKIVFEAINGILDALHAAFTAIVNSFGAVYDYLIQPIVKFLDIIGEYIDNANGGHYKSKMPWFGDGKPIMTHDKNNTWSISGSSSFNGGGYSGSGYGDYGNVGNGDIIKTTSGYTLSIPEEQFNRSNIPENIKEIAKAVSKGNGIPADWLAVLLGFESGWGKSNNAREANNYGNVMAASGEPYRVGGNGAHWKRYSSPMDFANQYASYLVRKFPATKSAKNLQQFLSAIHNGVGGADYAPARENPNYDGRFFATYKSRFGSGTGNIHTVNNGSPAVSQPEPTQVASNQNVQLSHQSSIRQNAAPSRYVERHETVTNHKFSQQEVNLIQSGFSRDQPATVAYKAA